MNLVELKEKMYMENVRMFKEFFLEDDEDIKYVVINVDNEEEFVIVDREGLVNLIHSDLNIEYVEEDFCLGILNGQAVRIEYM